GPFRPQVRYLDEPFRLVLDDFQCVGTEVLHDAFGHLRADALDQPGAQVTADPLHRRRQDGGVVVHVELLAVLGVRAPASTHTQRFPGLYAHEGADHGEQVAAAPGVDTGDGESVVLVGVGDSFQYPLDDGHALIVVRHLCAPSSARPGPFSGPITPDTAHDPARALRRSGPVGFAPRREVRARGHGAPLRT